MSRYAGSHEPVEVFLPVGTSGVLILNRSQQWVSKMKSSCISHDKREPLIIIRKSYVELCSNNHCAAALISYFEYWHNIKLDMQSRAEKANAVAVNHGDEPTQDTSLLQFHTADDLVNGMVGLFKIAKIRDAIELLKSLKIISVHKNPNPRYKFDNTRYFLFNPDMTKKTYRHDENSISYDENNTRSVENDGRDNENNTRSVENDTTITETTTETTTDIISADAQKTTKVGLKDLLVLGVERQTASDWLEVRKLKRAALTQTVINLLVNESAKAGISINDAVRVCAENSWQGFKADWYFNLNKQANKKEPISKHGGFGQRDYNQGINEDGSF